MSLRVVGYEGHGKTRRAIRVDEGPASARIATTLGEGKAGLIAGIPERQLVGGYGEVERRYIDSIDEATRQEARAARVRGVPIEGRAPAGTGLASFQQSRQRGAQRAGFTPGATKPYLAARNGAAVQSSSEEVPVMAAVQHPLKDLSEAVDRVARWAVAVGEAESALLEAQQQQEAARADLRVAWLAAGIGETVAGEPPRPRIVPDPGPSRPAASKAPRQPGHHSSKADETGEKAARAERVMAAIARHGDTPDGVRRAASELGMKLNAVVMVAKHARARRTS